MGTILDVKGLCGLTPEALLAMNWWAAAIRGVSAIVLGLLAIMLPALTLVGLVIIFAVYCLVDGIFAIVLAIRGARKHQRWGWLALNGVVSLIVAAAALFYPFITILVLIALFAAWAMVLLPTLGMVTLTFLVGFQALFAGITLLALAFRLRARSLEVAPAVVAARDDASVAPEAEAKPV